MGECNSGNDDLGVKRNVWLRKNIGITISKKELRSNVKHNNNSLSSSARPEPRVDCETHVLHNTQPELISILGINELYRDA